MEPCVPFKESRADVRLRESVPQRLTPQYRRNVYGTGEAVPLARRTSSGSDPVQWRLPAPDKSQKVQYRHSVTIRRRGDFVLPVVLELTFDDHTKIREQWVGQDGWKTFTYNRTSKIVSAEIDPDHTLLLDKDLFNNSYTTDANRTPARRMTTIYLSALQLMSQLIPWIA